VLTAEQKAVKARLSQYLDVKRERDQMARMLKDLESHIYAAGVPAYDGMPRSPGVGDPTGNNATQHTALQARYEAKVAELDAAWASFEDLIAPLSTEERVLLRYRYIAGMTMEQVAEAMTYCLRHIYTLHKACLDKLAAAGQGMGQIDFDTERRLQHD
jgi:DNA-directed RNA polymerase specialized sigma24 family protein